MPKEIKLPEFEVRCEVHGDPFVTWQDASRKYHIWLTEAGDRQSDILHSNPIEPSKRWNANEHRALDATAKKWAPLVAAILAKIKADDLVSKARAAAHEKAQREADERRRQASEKALAVLAEACAFLPRDLADAITARPDLERLAFVEGIVAGIRR
jgi:hypothetical protein